jgi:hypothetical protein
LNSKVRNSAWLNKRTILSEFSTLPITTKYTSFADWDESSIDDRATDLSSMAITIWKKYKIN